MLIVAALLLAALNVVPAPWGVALVAGAIAFEIAEKGFLVRYTRRIPLAAGPAAMIGRTVTVVAACRPAGRVRFGSESWSARCPEGAGVGESLVIDAVENVTLVVGRLSALDQSSAESQMPGNAIIHPSAHRNLETFTADASRESLARGRGPICP